MNLIDCCMYFDEDMLLDIRLNILDKYVKKFIICEAEYNHNGLPKKLNFNIEKFKKFKDKIVYLPLNLHPKDLILKKRLELDNSSILDNALKRENFQRNYLSNEIQKSGIPVTELDAFYNYCVNEINLNIIGLMVIPPNDDNFKKYFKSMSELNNSLAFKELSMGMSADYIDAVKHGATFVRIGSSIFGSRS